MIRRPVFGFFCSLLIGLILTLAAAGPVVQSKPKKPAQSLWRASDLTKSAERTENDTGQIRYGRDLIARTAYYLGPKGKVARLSNGMNCQNCHLEAGTKFWGNNYGAVAATYPKFRERSGTKETII